MSRRRYPVAGGVEPPDRNRVVVVGGGFGGVQAALRLARLPVEVTLVDRNNYFLFQLLAYQVATGGLSPAEIAYPLRRIFRRHRNVRVILAEVTDFDLEARIVQLSPVEGADAPASLAFDTLIVARGARYSYFGHEAWARNGTDLKTLESALTVRRRILAAFEAAELEPDAERRAAWLTVAVIGAGPTGVEIAGQIAEMARDLRSDFREPDCAEVQVLLVEAGDRVLSGFPPSPSKKARRSLARLGINTRLRYTVVNLDDRSVTLMTPGEPPDHIRARTVVWAAGVVAADVAASLRTGPGPRWIGRGESESGRTSRCRATQRCSRSGICLASTPTTGWSCPCRAPRPSQCSGAYAARVVRDRLQGRSSPPFR